MITTSFQSQRLCRTCDLKSPIRYHTMRLYVKHYHQQLWLMLRQISRCVCRV